MTHQQKDQMMQQNAQLILQQNEQLLVNDEVIQRQNELMQQKDQQLQLQNQQMRHKDQQIQQRDQQIQQLLEDNRNFQHSLQHGDKSAWIIRREEIITSENILEYGGLGLVKEGIFCGSRVAVKSLNISIISPYYRELFAREMNMAVRFRHPNLVQFIAAIDEGVPLIVTELMHTSVRNIVEQGQLHSNQIIPILLGVACGLKYLHKITPNPIIHCDISSANVLLNLLPNSQWHPKLSDFASANFMRASCSTAPGNPSYAAPEVLQPGGLHTTAMDVFSFGVLMYEMCSRRFPTEKPDQSMLYYVNWDTTESKLVGMIHSCLSQDIAERPSMLNVIIGLKC